MERPGDDYGELHNVRLEPRDSLFGGQVSRLQVAQLVGTAIANTQLAENKVCLALAPSLAVGLSVWAAASEWCPCCLQLMLIRDNYDVLASLSGARPPCWCRRTAGINHSK